MHRNLLYRGSVAHIAYCQVNFNPQEFYYLSQTAPTWAFQKAQPRVPAYIPVSKHLGMIRFSLKTGNRMLMTEGRN